jgi:uncharacterized membrane protein
MSEERNRRSTDAVEKNPNNPEWLSAVVTLAPIAMSMIQLLLSMVHSRPPKKAPTSSVLPLVDESTAR